MSVAGGRGVELVGEWVGGAHTSKHTCCRTTCCTPACLRLDAPSEQLMHSGCYLNLVKQQPSLT